MAAATITAPRSLQHLSRLIRPQHPPREAVVARAVLDVEARQTEAQRVVGVEVLLTEQSLTHLPRTSLFN